MPPHGFKQRVHDVLEAADARDGLAKFVNLTIITLIVINVSALVVESMDGVYSRAPWLFQTIEIVTVAAFTVEYVLRLWACTVDPRFAHPVAGRLRYAASGLLIVDLLAIFPFYAVFFLPFLGWTSGLRTFRAVRIFRLFRVAKLGRYSTAMRTLRNVVRRKKEQLLTTLMFMLVLLLIASSTMYFAENAAQPEKFSSIPATMWWSVCTLTTVGYGDMIPLTPLGKLTASVVAILGIAMFALPTGILGAGFVEELEVRSRRPVVCPHCGGDVESAPRMDGTSDASGSAPSETSRRF